MEREEAIRAELDDAGKCWDDADCVAVDFGCPWQYGACQETLVSNSEKDLLDEIEEKMGAFEQECVMTNAVLKKKCAEYDAQVEALDCDVDLEPVCYNGRCLPRSVVGPLLDMGL